MYCFWLLLTSLLMYLRAAAGSGNDGLLCHVHRPAICQRLLLQQLFPVSTVATGNQPGNSQVAVGTEWTDDYTRKNSHTQVDSIRRLRIVHGSVKYFTLWHVYLVLWSYVRVLVESPMRWLYTAFLLTVDLLLQNCLCAVNVTVM